MTFPHTATVLKLEDQSGKDIYMSQGTTPCFLQPLDTESAQAYGITFTKAWGCYFPYDSDVVAGDRVEIAGISYGVAGVRSHNYGSLMHKRAVLEQA